MCCVFHCGCRGKRGERAAISWESQPKGWQAMEGAVALFPCRVRKMQVGGVRERLKPSHLSLVTVNHLLESSGCQKARPHAFSGHLGDGRQGELGLSKPGFDTVEISCSSFFPRDSACQSAPHRKCLLIICWRNSLVTLDSLLL